MTIEGSCKFNEQFQFVLIVELSDKKKKILTKAITAKANFITQIKRIKKTHFEH